MTTLTDVPTSDKKSFVGGLDKKDFKDVYKVTASIYKFNQLQAKRELPRLVEAIKVARKERLPKPRLHNLELTFFMCSLFTEFGKDEESAWKMALKHVLADGSFELRLSEELGLRIDNTEPTTKKCSGADCTHTISEDIDLCISCRNRKPRPKKNRTVLTTER